MTLTGELLIGSSWQSTSDRFDAIDPATGETLEPSFSAAGPEEVARACALAANSFDAFRKTGLEARARFLECIGEEITALGDELLDRAARETGLPLPRLEMERGRTVGQLRLFAELVRSGDWLSVRVDPAQPKRKPAPRPDLRQRNVGIGPVAVFGPSNFPLAFSVAGGDTASAFAAGCPVVVKGHPGHPGTSELAARAVAAAVRKSGMPGGIFSYLGGPSHKLGAALVADSRIKAVGFTGSRQGGLSVMRIANARVEPIPVYAEMGSINPVILLPGALRSRAEEIATGFVGSLSMGAGQFCTNPGLVIGIEGSDLDRFATAAAKALAEVEPAVMLTPKIHDAYVAGVDAQSGRNGVECLGRGAAGGGKTCARGVLFSAPADTVLTDPDLATEIFGPASLLLRCKDEAELVDVLEHLEGQLTAALHLEGTGTALARRLLPILERKAGRILANGWPTGVEVCHAMVHGGPYPATSDSRSTSVGSRAIERFLRPICYQNLPDVLLPDALKHDNPLGLLTRIDGKPQLS